MDIFKAAGNGQRGKATPAQVVRSVVAAVCGMPAKAGIELVFGDATAITPSWYSEGKRGLRNETYNRQAALDVDSLIRADVLALTNGRLTVRDSAKFSAYLRGGEAPKVQSK